MNFKTCNLKTVFSTVSLQFSCSCKIQVLPAAAIVISICCDVLWWLVQFIHSYEWQKDCSYPQRQATDHYTLLGGKNAECSERQVQCLLDKFPILSTVLANYMYMLTVQDLAVLIFCHALDGHASAWICSAIWLEPPDSWRTVYLPVACCQALSSLLGMRALERG